MENTPTFVPARNDANCVLAISALSTDYGWDEDSFKDEERSTSSLGSIGAIDATMQHSTPSRSGLGFRRFGISDSVFSIFNNSKADVKNKGKITSRHIGTIPEEGEEGGEDSSTSSQGGDVTFQPSHRAGSDSDLRYVPTFRPKGSNIYAYSSKTSNASSSHISESSSLDEASREFQCGISGDGTFSEWTDSECDASSTGMRQSSWSRTSGLFGSEKSGTASMMRQSSCTDTSGLLGSDRSGDISMNPSCGRRYLDINRSASGSSGEDSSGSGQEVASSMMRQSSCTDTSGLLGSDRSGDISMNPSCGRRYLDINRSVSGSSGEDSSGSGQEVASSMMRQSSCTDNSGLLGSDRSGDISMNPSCGRRYLDINRSASGSSGEDSSGSGQEVASSMMRQSSCTDTSGLLGSDRSGDISMNPSCGRRYLDINRSALGSSGEDSSGSGKEVASSMMRQSSCTDNSGLLGSDRSGASSMNVGMSDTASDSSNSSQVSADIVLNGLAEHQRVGILCTSNGNTQMQQLFHKRKILAFEVDVTDYQEEPPIPHHSRLLFDRFGNRHNPYTPSREKILCRTGTLPSKKTTTLKIEHHTAIPEEVRIEEPKQKCHSYMAIMAAILLAAVVVVMGIDSLSDQGYEDEARSRHLVQSYQFGGGLGGLLGGMAQEEQRRQYAGDARDDAAAAARNPAQSQVSTSRPDTNGEGRFNQVGNGGQQQLLPTLTSTPLTSYAPPNGEAAPTNVILDPTFDHQLRDLSIMPYNPHLDIPIFLDLPLTGGSAAKSILGNCLKMIQCTNHGHEILIREQHIQSNSDGRDVEGNGNNLRHRSIKQDQEDTTSSQNSIDFDPPLRTEVVFTPTTTSISPSTYVNVDCSTPSGVNRGIQKELVTSDMVDVIYSPHIHDVARLFDPSGYMRGRAVVILRNPIERTVAKYLRLANNDDNVKKMSLAEFARSSHLENNILTRALAGKGAHEHLSGYDLVMAKEILKRKFVVGLFGNMKESFERFETFFGWNVSGASTCQQNEINRVMEKLHNKNIEMPQNAAVLMALAEKNRMDIMLYDYARFLYEYQGRVLFGINKA